MILNLVRKDLRAFGSQMVFFIIMLLSFNSFMAANDRSGSWWLFILITSAGISTLLPAFVILDRNSNGELLSCSLPVNRKTIIKSKFVLLTLTAICGYLAINIAAFLMDATLNFYDYYIFTNPILLTVIFTYFSLFICITILVYSSQRGIVAIVVADIIFLVTFILGVEKLVFPHGIENDTENLQKSIIPIIIIITSICVIIFTSVKISIKNYSKNDI